MLHPQRVVQDENSTAPIASKSLRDADSRAAPGKASAKVQRKALGNITNVTIQHNNLAKGKTPSSTQPPPRKIPLGDVSNSKATARPLARQQPSKEAVAPHAAGPKAKLDLLAEEYAKGGTENLAGKGWRQLQAEAEQAQEQAIAARVKAITSIPYHLPLAFLSQDRAARRRQEPVDPLPQPPSPQVTPRDASDEWDCVPTSACMAQLPSVSTDVSWGIDETVIAASEAGGSSMNSSDDMAAKHTLEGQPSGDRVASGLE